MSGRTQRGTSVPAVLSSAECEALGRRVLELTDGAPAEVKIASGTNASNEFARGDTHEAYETTGVEVELALEMNGDRHAKGRTTQVDDAGLRTLAREVRELARTQRTPRPTWKDEMPAPQPRVKGPELFFEAALDAMEVEAQAAVFRKAVAATQRAGLVAAGTVSVSAQAQATLNTKGLWVYERSVFGEFSLTAKTKDGTGSGWAWSGYEDWARVTIDDVITRAVEIAERSANPTAIEPGRYTVILEPTAVAELINPIQGQYTAFLSAEAADQGGTVFSGTPVGTNKIGLQMLDRRLGLVADPWDPEHPKSTVDPQGNPLVATTWLKDGVLQTLRYTPHYARLKGRDPVFSPGGVRLTAAGETQSLQEMIASTARGIWVNRLSGVVPMDTRTLLLTGVTRDGTFLIENGKITRPIKNLRFTDSPFFALNRLEAWGEPVRAARGVVAPRLKLRDFNFTSMSDAI